MLKQEPDPQEQSAGQMRVKKEEFARAIAALEARRQAVAQEQEGTVIIGDVLQQLQINVPADEVLQEIEALHAGQPREESVRRPLWNAEQAAAAKLVAGIVLIPPVVIAIAVLMLNPLRPPANPPNRIATNGPNQISVGSPYSYARNPMHPFPYWMPHHLPNIPANTTGEVMDEGGFNASSILKPLSAVPDNQPIHCTTASLNQLCNSFTRSLMNKPWTRPGPYDGTLDPTVLAQSSQLFDVRPNLHKPWTLIKHDNKLYLRGWVAAKFTQAQAQGQTVTVHGSPHSFDLGIQPTPITLPMSFLQYSGDTPLPFFSNPLALGEQQLSLKAHNVVLDKHAWEKW
jgi:hypothetical protein